MKELKDYIHFYLGCEVEYEGILNGKEMGEELKANKHDVFYIPKVEAVRGVKRGYLKEIRQNIDGSRKYRIGNRGLQSHYSCKRFKPALRPLSDMTEEEMSVLVQILFSDVDDKIDPEELQLEMFYWDNATMVDGDIQVRANISCRCFQGQLAIRECGSMQLFDDDKGSPVRLNNIPEGTRYLLSKRFDLFGLIEAGLAIKKQS